MEAMSKPKLSSTLVKLRNNAGLTQKELSIHLNYSDKVISKWERDESVPDVFALERIAEFYKMTIDELMEGGSSMSTPSAKPFQLDFQMMTGPPMFTKISILFPILFWVITPWIDLILFVVFGIVLIALVIVWGFAVSRSEWKTSFNQIPLRVTTSGLRCDLYYGQKKVDEVHSMLGTFHLSVKIQDDLIKIRVSQMGIKIHVFATVE